MIRVPLLSLIVLMLAAPAALQAQRTDADDARRATMQARRDSLEAEVVQKFLERLTRDLRLDAEQRAHTERVLKRSRERSNELMRKSVELRGRLYRAVRSDTATDAAFLRLLADHETLRAREQDLWRQDQNELAAVLTARQRAQFILSWAHFQETIREIMSQRPRDELPLLM